MKQPQNTSSDRRGCQAPGCQRGRVGGFRVGGTIPLWRGSAVGVAILFQVLSRDNSDLHPRTFMFPEREEAVFPMRRQQENAEKQQEMNLMTRTATACAIIPLAVVLLAMFAYYFPFFGGGGSSPNGGLPSQ